MTRFDVEKHSKSKTDVKDKKILYLLSCDSRESLGKIGKKILLSQDSVSYRIKDMKKSGIIQGFIPRINYEMLGFQKINAFFQIINLGKKNEHEFVKFLKSQKNIINIIQYADKFDFEVNFLVKSVHEFDETLNNITDKFHFIIGDIDVFHEVNTIHDVSLPENFAKIKPSRKRMPKKEDLKLDETDKRIINELLRDARESSVKIAKRLKTSPDTILYRIEKLQKNGIIDDFTTVVNFTSLDMSWYTLLFNLKSLSNVNYKKLKEYVRKHPNIVGCFKGIGAWNLKFYIVAQSRKEFHNTVSELRITFRDIIKDYDTLVGYKEHILPILKI